MNSGFPSKIFLKTGHRRDKNFWNVEAGEHNDSSESLTSVAIFALCRVSSLFVRCLVLLNSFLTYPTWDRSVVRHIFRSSETHPYWQP